MRPTPVIDRFYFKSAYFREPNGIPFELATLGPGLQPMRTSSISASGCPAAGVRHLREQTSPP